MTHHPRRDEALLGRLLSEVNRLRVRIRGQRGLPITSTTRAELARSYEELANALEAYADEATESGVPLPYRFRDELHVYRSMGEQKT